MEEWNSKLIERFNSSRNSREIWTTYKKMTKKKDCNTILPLIAEGNAPAFSEEEKCTILQDTFFKGGHLRTDEYDDTFYKETMEEYEHICNMEDKIQTTKHKLDYEITSDEVEDAIFALEIGKSPGADDHFPELFKFAGPNFIEAMRVMINLSWNNGKLPTEWKTANVKFLRKQGKTNYYSPSSYRPISLTSVMCKITERIILNRLAAFIEGMQIIDINQEGFRKNHSTSNCLLRFIQNVIEKYNKGEITLACLIDLEKAYDSIWREGLMVKLHKLGIQGKTWKWIKNFLNNRMAKCIFDGFIGTEFETNIGLPQGSVLAPTLFNIYINDFLNDIKGENTKFADDGTMWQSRKPEEIDELKEEMAQDIGKAIEWTRKWRVNISIEKTEVCMFTKKKISKEDKTIQLNGKELNYNPNPKLLGVILDEKMTFGKHLETLEKRASRNLTILREVRQISKMNTKKLLQLYFCLIRSVVYSCPAWQVAEQKDLDRLQRKALTLCLDMPSTSGRAALEIEAGVLPIDLRIEEIAIREIAKIQSKSIKEPIKQQLINYQEEIVIHITPMGKVYVNHLKWKKKLN
ncbi:unnamed protein product [Mytilus edulis]|uniref:Reverse transcriptase domain-containing protein n=1 Tax=Mytilus edulis TaxID=6550 RepID=A0A8S3RTY7_MYTED|nr:unnamed protein product [Mytilus edulis]